MAEQEQAGDVRLARLTVTVARPEWGGAATIHGKQWQRAAWAGRPADEVRQVVFLPGACADMAPRAPGALLAAAARRETPLAVTTLDLPEYAGSRLPPGWGARIARAGSLIDDALLLQAVLDRVVPEPYTLVGWSNGGNLAAIMAAVAPERVQGLVLCMPAGLFDQPVIGHLVPQFALTLLETVLAPADRQAVLNGDPLGRSRDMLLGMARLPELLPVVRLLARANAVPFAARVRCPVTVVLGRHDRVFDRLIDMNERGELVGLFAASPVVRVQILEDANHNGFAAHAAEVAPLILDTPSAVPAAFGANGARPPVRVGTVGVDIAG